MEQDILASYYQDNQDLLNSIKVTKEGINKDESIIDLLRVINEINFYNSEVEKMFYDMVKIFFIGFDYKFEAGVVSFKNDNTQVLLNYSNNRFNCSISSLNRNSKIQYANDVLIIDNNHISNSDLLKKEFLTSDYEEYIANPLYEINIVDYTKVKFDSDGNVDNINTTNNMYVKNSNNKKVYINKKNVSEKISITDTIFVEKSFHDYDDDEFKLDSKNYNLILLVEGKKHTFVITEDDYYGIINEEPLAEEVINACLSIAKCDGKDYFNFLFVDKGYINLFGKKQNDVNFIKETLNEVQNKINFYVPPFIINSLYNNLSRLMTNFNSTINNDTLEIKDTNLMVKVVVKEDIILIEYNYFNHDCKVLISKINNMIKVTKTSRFLGSPEGLNKKFKLGVIDDELVDLKNQLMEGEISPDIYDLYLCDYEDIQTEIFEENALYDINGSFINAYQMFTMSKYDEMPSTIDTLHYTRVDDDFIKKEHCHIEDGIREYNYFINVFDKENGDYDTIDSLIVNESLFDIIEPENIMEIFQNQSFKRFNIVYKGKKV